MSVHVNEDDSRTSKAVPSWKMSKYSFTSLATRLRTGIAALLAAVGATTRRIIGHSVRQLRALVPSRRFMARFAFLVIGSGLVMFSLSGFANGEILRSFIILPIGYAIAVCFWLLLWNSRLIEAPVSETRRTVHATVTPAPARRVRLSVGTRSKSDSPTRVNVSFKPRSYSFKWNKQRSGQYSRTNGSTVAKKSVQLVCGPCGKQYSVRGEGQVSGRLIPCPKCGSALATTAQESTEAVRKDPSWVPIVSVVCKQCRGLIDVPYSSMGKSVACPRCQAELTVPAIASQKAREKAFSQLAQA